jgi:[FeFe] hydrogenase H-cluster maturation GTPase HydF
MKNDSPHIGIFGRRNSGKSSLINLLTGQDIAIVSEQAGTTTDPVRKSVEIFGIGPTVLIDTAGMDDDSALGEKRLRKTMETLNHIDAALLLFADNQFGEFEIDFIRRFQALDIPYIIVHNKSDLTSLNEETKKIVSRFSSANLININTFTHENAVRLIESLKEIIGDNSFRTPSMFRGIVCPKDPVLLITPIDSEAPEGRMILPQNMAIRSVLDENCLAMVIKDTEIDDFFKLNICPALVVTDSQVFDKVARSIPEEIPLTSFSILMAKMKGDFDAYLQGTQKISELNDGDHILIMESCTHQTSCDDIGRIKIPKLLRSFTGKDLYFSFLSGLSEPDRDVSQYALVVQCGGCMITRKQLANRLTPFIEMGIPVTNYGMALAYVNGIFERATRIFRQN